MKKMRFLGRMACVCLAMLMTLSLLCACSGSSEIPDGYQYATCNGEYFRLFIPTQWTVNTDSGVSGGFYSHTDEATVTMTQIDFVAPEGTPENKELEAFYDNHVAEISQLRKYALVRELDTTQSGYRAKEIYYSASVGNKDCKIRQVLTKVAGRFYLFTYSANAEVFDNWLDIVDDILLQITFESYPYAGSDDRKTPTDVIPPAGMKLVSDDEVAYRFFAPESWIRDTNVGQNLVYASESDRSNVSMIAYAPEDDTMTIDQYWALCRDLYASALENFTIISEGEERATADTTTETIVETTVETTAETMVETTDGVAITMGGQNAKVYEYTYTLGGVNYHVRQVITKHSAMIYAMTYTALPENYEAHLDEVIAMQEALTFRKNMFD